MPCGCLVCLVHKTRLEDMKLVSVDELKSFDLYGTFQNAQNGLVWTEY